MSTLDIKALSASFSSEQGRVRVLDDISLNIGQGESLGLVGESGCGKSITALSIMRLLPKPAGQVDAGEILFNGRDLLTLPAGTMRGIRGNEIAMIFQEPMTALNPVQKIGKQMQEPFLLHKPELSKAERIERAISSLDEVGIPSPRQRLEEYPHQLSGGMRQRVMIAMALSLEPKLLIADEPTTALDVTIQAQILSLINRLKERHGTAVLFITHDLGVIAETCDRVAVMYAGRIAESATVAQFFRQPLHPYSRGLLNAIPQLDRPPRTMLRAIPGNVPAIDQLSDNCRFADRCQYRRPRCETEKPSLERCDGEQLAACFFWREGLA